MRYLLRSIHSNNPVIQPYRFASLVNQIPRVPESRSTYPRKVDRWPNYIPTDHSEVCFVWNGWYLTTLAQGVAIDIDTYVVTRAYASCNGVLKQLTFGGETSVTVTTGSNDVRCDPITPSDFGLTSFVGKTIWVTDCKYNPLGTAISYPYDPRNRTDEGANSIFYTDESQIVVGVNGLTKTGTTEERAGGHGPWCIGRPVSSSPVVWMARGDSITANTGDGTNNGIYGRGWFQRAIAALNIPSANFAVHGSSAVNGASDNRVSYWYPLCTDGVFAFGANDFSNNGGYITVSEMQSRATTILNQFVSAGFNRKFGMVLLPRSSSSDSFVTEANQTVLANWDVGGPPDLYSQSIVNLGFTGTLPMIGVRGVDAKRWKVNGTVSAYTSDGTHPSGLGAIALGAECAVLMA